MTRIWKDGTEEAAGGGVPAAHAASHTDGTDDIQSATNAQKGLATAAHITAVEANTLKVTNANHSGDVTGSGALTIANDAVTNAKAANMDTDHIKMRNTAGTGDPEDLKISELTEEPAPNTGDWILGETAEGDLVKYDVGDLPGGGGGSFNMMGEVGLFGITQHQLALGFGYFFGFYARAAVDLTTLIFEVVTAGAATIDIGIYNSAGTSVDTGSLTTSGTGKHTVTLDTGVTLVAGEKYWIGMSLKTGSSPYFVGNPNPQTVSACSKLQSVGAPYDLPASIGSTGAGSYQIWCGYLGTVTPA